MLAGISFKGKPYGVPFENPGIPYGHVIRTDFFKEAGIDYSKSFASDGAIFETAAKLVKKDSFGNVQRWGYSTIAPRSFRSIRRSVTRFSKRSLRIRSR